MKNKKHIAMRCNQEQFEAIKPKLEGLKIEDLSSFEDCPFLTNNLRGEKDLISNIGSHDTQSRGREYVEQWNEKIFLEACGIETPKFEITKETVIKYQMKEEFPEVFEVKLEVGKWYKSTTSKSFVFVKKILGDEVFGYGFDYTGKYHNDNIGWTISIEEFRKATPEEVTEALKKEAVSLGLVVGNYALFGEIKEARRISEEIVWNERHNCLCSGQNVLMNSSGQWATVIQTKTIQQAEELLKELGHEIKIVS